MWNDSLNVKYEQYLSCKQYIKQEKLKRNVKKMVGAAVLGGLYYIIDKNLPELETLVNQTLQYFNLR